MKRVALFGVLFAVLLLVACGTSGEYGRTQFTIGPEWTSDRNSLYARLGSPDSIDDKPQPRTPEEGAGSADFYSFEIWHYKHLNGIGDNVELQFVDACMCGDYKLIPQNPSLVAILDK